MSTDFTAQQPPAACADCGRGIPAWWSGCPACRPCPGCGACECGEAVHAYVPDVGETFEVTTVWDRPWSWHRPWKRAWHYEETHSYRVSSWMKRRPPPRVPYDGPDEQTRVTDQIVRELIAEGRIQGPACAGPDNVPLMWCTRDEAEYVCGVAGTIERVAGLKLTGRVSWPEELLAEERRFANMIAGEMLT